MAQRQSYGVNYFHPILRTICVLLYLSFHCSANGQDRLVQALQARLENGSKYGWSCEGKGLNRAAIDWSKIPAEEKDPIKNAHQQGVSAFQPMKGQEWEAHAIYDAVDGRYKYDFDFEGRNHGSYSDGKSMATITPTQSREGAGPAMVEIGGAKDVANLADFALYCVGLDYIPLRIIQLEQCFGTTEESISLEDFIYLMNAPNIAKTYSKEQAYHKLTLPAFNENKENTGQVIYQFGEDGALQSVAYKAAIGWSPSYTVEIENELVADIGIRVPAKVQYVDWVSGYSRKMVFSDWGVPLEKDFEFEFPDNAVVTDHQIS